MPKRLKIDLAVVILIAALSVPTVLLVDASFLLSTLLYFALPALYLLIRRPRNLKRIFTASFLIGGIFGFSLDFLATFNNGWAWSNGDKLTFHGKLFGVIVPDNAIWFFFWVFSIVVFYEHFVEHERSDKISPNVWYGLVPGFLWLVAILAAYFLKPDILRFRYAYLMLGLVALCPFSILL